MNTAKRDDQPQKSRGRFPAILGGLGVLLALAAAFLSLAAPGDSVGNVAAVEASLSSVAGQQTTSAVADDPDEQQVSSTVGEAEEQTVIAPNEVGRLDQLAGRAAAHPVRLTIDGISVDAPVEPYGVNKRTGQMDVPRNVDDIGWYRYGPSPGEPGSAVLAAHVDLSGQGPGVFFNLRDLEPGQEVVVDYTDGTSRTFVVQARVTYDKDELPLDKVFSRDGSPVLTLITCGGGFSPSIQSYDSNVVVYAVPIENVKDYPSLETA